MGNVIKAYRYRIVDNSAFEMPLPMKFTVWKADAPVADYIISEDEQVSYTIITKFKELMITTIHRPLDISDIYYMFSCRVFQDRTPFTKPILERMGLEKYNVCNILRRTHGISPYDDYWIRFDGEKITFDQAVEEFDKYLIGPEVQPVPVVSYPSGAEIAPEPKTAADTKVDEIQPEKAQGRRHRGGIREARFHRPGHLLRASARDREQQDVRRRDRSPAALRRAGQGRGACPGGYLRQAPGR